MEQDLTQPAIIIVWSFTGCDEMGDYFVTEADTIIGILSHGVASGSEITPCNKIDKPLVIYRFMGIVMTSISTLR